MHALFVTDLSVYMNDTYDLVSGMLLNVLVVPGSILVGFDLAASPLLRAPSQQKVLAELKANIEAGNIDIGYPFVLNVDPVSLNPTRILTKTDSP